MCKFCSTLLDTWAKGRSSHIMLRHYREVRCRQIFFNKIIMEMRPVVSPTTPKQSDRVLNGLVRHHLGRRITYQRSGIKTKLIIFFDSQGVVHKEFVPEGKKVNAEFYKWVMDHLLKRIQRFRTAGFCSRDFFLLLDKAPAHKAASVCQFLTAKKCYNPLPHPVLYRFISARLFSVLQFENEV